MNSGMSWKAIAAIFYEQYAERCGHYWACCRTVSDKSWYTYNDMNTGSKLKRLPEGLPNIYEIIYQASTDGVRQDASTELRWEYIQRILALEAGCMMQLEPRRGEKDILMSIGSMHGCFFSTDCTDICP
jgi:hypothetical protein